MGLLSRLGLGKKEKTVIDVSEEISDNYNERWLDKFSERHDRLMRQQARYLASGAAYGLPNGVNYGFPYF